MPDFSQQHSIFPISRIISASGYCQSCNQVHGLPMGSAYDHCRELIHHFQKNRTIDLKTASHSDPRLSTEYLFGPARGKMFGILKCRDISGKTIIIRAFSGQYNGLWNVPGWAPPLFDVDDFHQTNDPAEREIKAISREIDQLEPQTQIWLEQRKKRRTMSRELMQRLHSIYRLNNSHGLQSSLLSAYTEKGGIPTGTGDCCAPKLLNSAASRNLIPVSIAEFYWGKDNKSGTRKHNRCYPSCQEKCQPILGFLLCGLENDDAYNKQ